jgi:transcription elongation factor GreA
MKPQSSRQRRNTIVIGDDKPLLVTPDALRRLKEKYERLKQSLPELIAETQRTAAYGDRSENFAYQQAKASLRRANIQVLVVENQIRQAIVIKMDPRAAGTIQLGSTVVVESGSTGKKVSTFQILGSHETSPGQGRISNQSPLGAALLGKKQGETVIVNVAGKMQEYKIIEIR